MTRFNIDDDEEAALADLLSETIERDRFSLSPRVKRLCGVLAKARGRLGAGDVLCRTKAVGRAQQRADVEAAAIRARSPSVGRVGKPLPRVVPQDRYPDAAVGRRCGRAVRVSALAVCRLTASWNLVGCTTGRSAGLASKRIPSA